MRIRAEKPWLLWWLLLLLLPSTNIASVSFTRALLAAATAPIGKRSYITLFLFMRWRLLLPQVGWTSNSGGLLLVPVFGVKSQAGGTLRIHRGAFLVDISAVSMH